MTCSSTFAIRARASLSTISLTCSIGSGRLARKGAAARDWVSRSSRPSSRLTGDASGWRARLGTEPRCSSDSDCASNRPDSRHDGLDSRRRKESPGLSQESVNRFIPNLLFDCKASTGGLAHARSRFFVRLLATVIRSNAAAKGLRLLFRRARRRAAEFFARATEISPPCLSAPTFFAQSVHTKACFGEARHLPLSSQEPTG